MMKSNISGRYRFPKIRTFAVMLLLALLNVGCSLPSGLGSCRPLHKSEEYTRRQIDSCTERLYTAISNEDYDQIERLLERGTNINVRPHYYAGISPLMFALERNKTDMFHFLLEHGAELDTRTDIDETVLHFAVQYDNKTVFDFLLAEGFDVNVEDEYSRTPIFDAVLFRRAAMMEALIEQEASLSGVSFFQKTPLHEAFDDRKGSPDPAIITRLLEAGVEVNALDEQENSAFYLAVMAEAEPEILTLLLAHGADINTQNNFLDTPLLLSTRMNYFPMVEFLIAHGADPNLAHDDGQTAIDYAETAEMRALLAKVSTVSPDQQVLTYIQTRDHAALRELLQQQPHLSRVESYYGETPLHWAAYYGTVEMVDLVMAAGGEINRRDGYGYTPLHKAISAEMRHDMLDSVRVAEIEAIIRYLIEAGAVANTQKLSKDTPLNDAITWQIKPELIGMLLEAGAEPNITDEDGDTALHKAAATGEIAVVKLLLDAGADINALTVWRYTPLTIAVFNDAEEVVALLLEAGADPNIADADGNKPWHHAKKKGNKTIIDLLR